METMTQPVELLAVAPGESTTGEPTVIPAMQPDRDSRRSHCIALPRSFRCHSASALVLTLASTVGCSTEVRVTTERTVPKITAEAAQPATEKRTTTHVAVRLLDERKPSLVEVPSPAKPAAAAPEPDPKQAVEIVGDRNSVVVVEGDLHLHRHVHIHGAARLEHFQVEIRRYDVERDERCERLRREYEEKV